MELKLNAPIQVATGFAMPIHHLLGQCFLTPLAQANFQTSRPSPMRAWSNCQTLSLQYPYAP